MRKFRILAIDGGGLKGIFPAAFLAKVEAQSGKRIVEHFDLIAGTSTGGIIALGIGLGLAPAEILSIYESKAEQIFPSQRFLSSCVRSIRHLFYNKYSSEALERVLKDTFKNRMLGESKTRLVIPSFNPITGDVWIYKTAHHSKLKEDYLVEGWKVAMATSAAPSYFKSFGSIDLVDGGVWANNPSMVALTEAIGLLEISPKDIVLLSVGRSQTAITISTATLRRGGLIRWSWHIVRDLFMNVQSIAAHHQCENLLNHERYVRIVPYLNKGDGVLDKLKEATRLKADAEQAARHYRKTIEELFLNEKVIPFTPAYSVEKARTGQGLSKSCLPETSAVLGDKIKEVDQNVT